LIGLQLLLRHQVCSSCGFLPVHVVHINDGIGKDSLQKEKKQSTCS
jgi:hypothetical protein